MMAKEEEGKLKIRYLRDSTRRPFGVVMWNNANIGWSLCHDNDNFRKMKARELACAMAVNTTIMDAARVAMEPCPAHCTKQRALRETVRRITFPMIMARVLAA